MLGLNNVRRKDSGDTLIEVLFAMSVFAFIVVLSLSLMNQGVAASQRAFEITTVRQQMNGQAEALRFLHDSYVATYGRTFNLSDTLSTPAEEYYKVIQRGKTSASKFGGTATCTVPSNTSTDFVINPVTAKLVTTGFAKASTFSQLEYGTGGLATRVTSIRGMWVEAVRSPGGGIGYIDFHIRACWDVSGSKVPMTLGTIVRLYDPRV